MNWRKLRRNCSLPFKYSFVVWTAMTQGRSEKASAKYLFPSPEIIGIMKSRSEMGWVYSMHWKCRNASKTLARNLMRAEHFEGP
jgi:hypothetical protein